MSASNPYTSSNHSTETALSILEVLAESGNSMRLRDISEALSVNVSTASRFLNTFVNCGYAEQDPDTLRYRLTYKLCRIASQIQENTPLRMITHPYLAELSAAFSEACCVSVESGMRMIYIDTCSPQGQSLMSRQQVGGEAPMHCTGNGKLALLGYSASELDKLIAEKGLERLTDNTICSRSALCAELERIRRQGFAEDLEECEVGVRCLAFPIIDCSGRFAAGISITGPVSRMTDAAVELMKPALKAAAESISEGLGMKKSAFNN